MNSAIERSKTFSTNKVKLIRKSLKEQSQENMLVLTNGSFARKEASKESDIDFLIVSLENELEESVVKNTSDSIHNIIPMPAAANGAFNMQVSRNDFLSNLGGDLDTNNHLTRRLLLLLEGDWLTNPNAFNDLRKELIEKYIGATPNDHQLPLFLLNDIIRYWRTITVDYMYKTTEDEKPWAIRNIKLIFSRKLMYAGGLFSVASSVNYSQIKKIEHLIELFNMPAIDRMEHICGSKKMLRATESYNFFLEKMMDKKVRDHLKNLPEGKRDDEQFRELKNESYRFTYELMKVFNTTFHQTHPIHKAILF